MVFMRYSVEIEGYVACVSAKGLIYLYKIPNGEVIFLLIPPISFGSPLSLPYISPCSHGSAIFLKLNLFRECSSSFTSSRKHLTERQIMIFWKWDSRCVILRSLWVSDGTDKFNKFLPGGRLFSAA